MHVNGPSYIHGPQALQGPHRTTAARSAPASESMSGADEISISREADLISRARELPAMRMERISTIKAAIQNGTYETPERLERAVDRLLDEIA